MSLELISLYSCMFKWMGSDVQIDIIAYTYKTALKYAYKKLIQYLIKEYNVDYELASDLEYVGIGSKSYGK